MKVALGMFVVASILTFFFPLFTVGDVRNKVQQHALNSEEKDNVTRIGEECSKSDIRIIQAPAPPLFNGIPQYSVEIINECPSDCSISNIIVHCGWFSSVRLIPPNVFKRLKYDECLVNGGRPLKAGSGVFFTYANSFQYPLSVKSVKCGV